jgi:hypothetical protein
MDTLSAYIVSGVFLQIKSLLTADQKAISSKNWDRYEVLIQQHPYDYDWESDFITIKTFWTLNNFHSQ